MYNVEKLGMHIGLVGSANHVILVWYTCTCTYEHLTLVHFQLADLMLHQAPPQSGSLASRAPPQTPLSPTAPMIYLVTAGAHTVKTWLCSVREVSAYTYYLPLLPGCTFLHYGDDRLTCVYICSSFHLRICEPCQLCIIACIVNEN